MENNDFLKERVLVVLEHLEPGQYIKGFELMERTAIKERRTLYNVIRALRNEGNLIGSCKDEPGGYFLIRDDRDLERTVHTLEAGANDLLKTAAALRNVYEKQKNGGAEDDKSNSAKAIC